MSTILLPVTGGPGWPPRSPTKCAPISATWCCSRSSPNVRVSEAPSYGQSVITYDPGSSGALAYVEAARELSQRSPEMAS